MKHLKDSDLKRFDPPEERVGLPVYLLQRADTHVFLIHREVLDADWTSAYGKPMIRHAGRWFLACVLSATSAHAGRAIIHRHWRAAR